MPEFSPIRFLISRGLLFLASGAATVAMILQVDPFMATFIQLTLFYTAIFLLFWSLFSVLGYVVRVYSRQNNPLSFFAQTSSRQGALLAILAMAIFFLQGFRALSLLSVVLLVLALTLLEFAYLTR